jgi:anti-sigma factor RsiW
VDELTDRDLELLEAHLDGALSVEQAREVEARLGAEPALMAEMLQLREERAMRRTYWSGLEPPQAESDALAQRIIGRLNHVTAPPVATRPLRWPTLIRWSGAAAACVVLALMLAYYPDRDGAGQQDAAASPQNSQSTTSGPVYNVSLMDPFGRVVAEQRFGSLQQAHEFARDVQRWQNREDQSQDTRVRMVSDRF